MDEPKNFISELANPDTLAAEILAPIPLSLREIKSWDAQVLVSNYLNHHFRTEGKRFSKTINGNTYHILYKHKDWWTGLLHRNCFQINHIISAPRSKNKEMNLQFIINCLFDNLKQNSKPYILCRLSTNQTSSIHGLENSGFRVIGTLLEYEYFQQRRFPKTELTLKNLGESSLSHARKIFSGIEFINRFSLDPMLGQETSKMVLSKVIEDISLNKPDHGFLGFIDRIPVAVITYKKNNLLSDFLGWPVWRLQLLGVDSAFQGKGMGELMMLEIMNRLGGIRSTWNLGIYAGNLPSCGLYSKLGFRMTGSYLTLRYAPE